jgi:hypothetical protein
MENTKLDSRKAAMKRSIDHMVAEVQLKCSNVSSAEKQAARQTLKQLRKS